MKNDLSKAWEILFDLWMKENHPYFYPVLGGSMILCVLSTVVGIVFVFWFDWWWKMALVSFTFGVLFMGIANSVLRFYIKQFLKD